MDRLQDAKLMKFSDPSDLFNNNLGEGLLLEILGRLPSRVAIRLKLVCKSWCSLISSQYFITFFNHRRHDPSLPPIHDPHSSSSGFIFQAVHVRCLSMVRWGYTHQYHDSANFHRLDLSFLPCPQTTLDLHLLRGLSRYNSSYLPPCPPSVTVKASCADLILCSIPNNRLYACNQFYVCNPLTKQWAALPPAPHSPSTETSQAATGFLCVPAPCSLCSQGVDNSRYNFMVVRILPHSPPLGFKVNLFSSEEGQWKTLVVSSPRPVSYGTRSYGSLVPYKGMLHWLISECVLVFDPYNSPERFSRVIDMPADMIAPEYRPSTIGLFKDCLRVTYIWGIDSEDPIYYIWELEDYNMGKWSLVHKIYPKRSLRLRPLPDPNPGFDPIVNLDPKIRETGFYYIDGSAFYWTNSSGWWVAHGIVHWITDPSWPTPVSPLTCTIQNNENTLGNS